MPHTKSKKPKNKTEEAALEILKDHAHYIKVEGKKLTVLAKPEFKDLPISKSCLWSRISGRYKRSDNRPGYYETRRYR